MNSKPSLQTKILGLDKNLDLKAQKYGQSFPLTRNPFKKWHVNCRCSCHKGSI